MKTLKRQTIKLSLEWDSEVIISESSCGLTLVLLCWSHVKIGSNPIFLLSFLLFSLQFTALSRFPLPTVFHELDWLEIFIGEKKETIS